MNLMKWTYPSLEKTAWQIVLLGHGFFIQAFFTKKAKMDKSRLRLGNLHCGEERVMRYISIAIMGANK